MVKVSPVNSGNTSSTLSVLDTSFTPLGERSWRVLVDYIKNVGDEAEASYLEIKSALDISCDSGKAKIGKSAVAKVAKFLLGAANRIPNDADRHFRGHAVLVIGVKKGCSPGVPRGVEAHDLENALRPYLGVQFPSFEMGRLAVDDHREVLLIIAMPPEEGQPIFPCFKDFQGDRGTDSLRDGAVYVRGQSNTREARSGEVLALVERARGKQNSPIDLEVTLEGSVYRVAHIDEVMRSLYAFEEEGFTKETAEMSRNENSSSSLFQISVPTWLAPPTASDRRRALDVWKRSTPEHIAAGREHLLGVSLDAVHLEVVSHGRFIAKPNLSVTFHECDIMEWLSADEADWRSLVKPVMREVDALGMGYDVSHLAVDVPDPQFSWENKVDGAHISIQVESFRPDTLWSSEKSAYVLLARDISAECIEVTWRLTEDGSDKVTTGSCFVATEPVIDARDLVERFFVTKTEES